jgi:DNA-binding NarL/FixJ family response regulator
LYEGYEEFHRGLQEVREGRAYISPEVQKLLDQFSEWPKTNDKASKRLLEVLALLCNGFPAESIGAELHVSRKTVYNDMDKLYDTFNVRNRDEMVARAWELQLVTQKDMRFFDRKQEKPLPEWAAVKQKTNRSLAAKSASLRIL